MTAETSVTVREALNDWAELVALEDDLQTMAAGEALFARRLLSQYAVEAAAAGDKPAARLLAAMGRTHARTYEQLSRAMAIATPERRRRRRQRGAAVIPLARAAAGTGGA